MKLKTKSSAKKRFSLTASGQVKMACGRKRHNMRKRNPRMLRQARGTTVMHPSDAATVKAHYLHV